MYPSLLTAGSDVSAKASEHAAPLLSHEQRSLAQQHLASVCLSLLLGLRRLLLPLHGPWSKSLHNLGVRLYIGAFQQVDAGWD